MKVKRAYKTELDPNNTQRTILLKHAGAARFAYNSDLVKRMEEYVRTGESSNAIELHRQLNALRGDVYAAARQVLLNEAGTEHHMGDVLDG